MLRQQRLAVGIHAPLFLVAAQRLALGVAIRPDEHLAARQIAPVRFVDGLAATGPCAHVGPLRQRQIRGIRALLTLDDEHQLVRPGRHNGRATELRPIQRARLRPLHPMPLPLTSDAVLREHQRQHLLSSIARPEPVHVAQQLARCVAVCPAHLRFAAVEMPARRGDDPGRHRHHRRPIGLALLLGWRGLGSPARARIVARRDRDA